jgi:hypothetical protein
MFLLLLTLISMDASLAIDVGLSHLTLLQKTGLLLLVVANKTYLKCKQVRLLNVWEGVNNTSKELIWLHS